MSKRARAIMPGTVCAIALAGCGARSQLLRPSPVEDVAPEDASRPFDARDAQDVVHRDAVDSFDAREDVADVRDVGSPDNPAVCTSLGVDAAVDLNGPDGSVCTATLSVQSLTGDVFCYLDQMVTDTPGMLRYDCAGGLAEAVFGEHTFVGTYRDGVLDVCLGTQFMYSDGCLWSSAQRITGMLASGAMTFSYHEAPIHGDHCDGACSVTGDVTVQ